MNLTDQLAQWGTLHTAARNAERIAAEHGEAHRDELQERARSLRESADRLHREVYSALGTRPSERPR